MWILTGPFDAEDLSSQKSKLLKTGKSYSLGRKGQPLLVASKKVSQHHCTFTVRAYTLDDVHDPDKQPKLEFVNERDKGMRLTRADTQIVCGPKSTVELRDGDVIFIVTGLPITVKWQSICCYSPNLRGKSNVSLEVCSKLGISIVYTPSPHITHHIIPTYIANASVAASLISAAQFVKLEWLSDILKNIDTLEETFVLPPISKYRPTFSPSLSPSQKVFRVWEPNEERLNMFAEYRFLVFGEKIREVEGDLRELIKRGGGYLETFDVAGGVAKLHKALTRGQAKEGQQLVAVADTKDVKAAIGQDEWKKLVAEVRSFGLHITSPETIVQSVLDIEPPLLTDPQPSPMDVDIQDSLLASTTSLPSYVPNSIPDEPSIPPDEPPPPRKRLLRRATSRQPSVEPTSETPEVKSESPKPRRLLLSRRAKTVEPNDNGEAPDKPPVTVEPTPGRPRLKRRLGAAAPGSATAETPIAQSQLPEFASVVGEPPLKKFKALFDASDPSRPETGSIDEDVLFSTGARTTTSQTQSQTQGFVRRPAVGSSLTALREEEEESQNAGGTQRGMKRSLGAVQEEDRGVEMVGANDDGEGAEPARKRQALENVNSVERTTATTAIPVTKSPKSSTAQKEKQPGAPVGKPDTDAEFLKAVASTKKGKRTEDVFDREFNNLRISKPRLREVNEEGQREEEWRKFTDFGDDAGLRGNFMVVMEMSIFRKEKKRGGEDGEEETEQVGAGKEVLEQWKDKPNFKKFKKHAELSWSSW
ncbi:hypothetical protein P691DRAFT_251672 [Macrolepiota fuliginosa MF-IS2]|uniref:FHA domain-containing protein n=1 Tax=Macrolepiota fuliginosa MF-IS2 TaxID=1400762 RepID=A0A9P6C1M1_9AGAR|nr:hypothetical protein P691DRAFT_251672 [Macrolepiota fuliginosa MF-IS2]